MRGTKNSIAFRLPHVDGGFIVVDSEKGSVVPNKGGLVRGQRSIWIEGGKALLELDRSVGPKHAVPLEKVAALAECAPMRGDDEHAKEERMAIGAREQIAAAQSGRRSL